MVASAKKPQAGKVAGSEKPAQAPRLSTDFLNRFIEALMLIEFSASDDSVIDDLRRWQGVGYREHFEGSALRCAADALAAYDGIDPARRRAFEEVCRSMTRLVATVNALLAETPRPAEFPMIVEVAGEAMRKLISRSAQFINADGAIDIATFDDAALQSRIDALLAR